jgi:hypothetical protein
MRTCLALLLLVAVTTAAIAVEAVIQGESVSLPAPAGFCELSESDRSDERLIFMLGTRYTQHNRLLSVSADCGQLADWHAGKRRLLDDLAHYVSSERVHAPPQLCIAFRSWGPKIQPNYAPDIKAAAEARFQHLKGLKRLTGDGPIGALAEDPDTCYGAFLIKYDTDTFRLKLVAYTIVKNRQLYVDRYRPYTGPDSAIDALAKLKEIVAALHAANR